MFFFIVLV